MTPKANEAWWRAKIEANMARDKDTDELLHSAGWRALRVWEHVMVTDAADLVVLALRGDGRCEGAD